MAAGAPGTVTFRVPSKRTLTWPCPAPRSGCSYTPCGDTNLLTELSEAAEFPGIAEQLFRKRMAVAQCLNGITLAPEDQERTWTLRLSLQQGGAIELGEVAASRRTAGRTRPLDRTHEQRNCFEIVLRGIRLEQVPRRIDLDWAFSVIRPKP